MNGTKQKQGVDMMHTNVCVTFDMSITTPQSNSSALPFFFFKKKLFFRNNSVKQNRLEGQN